MNGRAEARAWVEAAPSVASPASASEKLVIQEAELRLRCNDPKKLVGKSAELARRYGGYVVSSETSQVDATVAKVDVSLRVRAEHLDAALAELRKLGGVLKESVTGQDVTDEFVDVQARLEAKQVLERRTYSDYCCGTQLSPGYRQAFDALVGFVQRILPEEL